MHGVWRMKPPKLIMTIHGGISDFECVFFFLPLSILSSLRLQPKLARALRRGIMKAAESTDTWIITSGVNEGAVRHFSEALEGTVDHTLLLPLYLLLDLNGNRKNKTCYSIGISPWGLLKKKNRLIGEVRNK